MRQQPYPSTFARLVVHTFIVGLLGWFFLFMLPVLFDFSDDAAGVNPAGLPLHSHSDLLIRSRAC